jgi:uncharacterized membrane protein
MPTTTDDALTKEQAQKRVDRIRAFRQELDRLETEGIVQLPEEQRRAVARHHDEILEGLARQFDIDRSDAQKQMSIGMQVTSLVGAIAFSVAVFLFFYRFWGVLTMPAQVAILVAAPILATLGVDVAARREKTLYFASILGLVAFACFILDISVLAGIFNVRDSPGGLLVWALFALALAYAYDLTWLLFVGVVMAAAFVAATIAQTTGIAWGFFLMRPEGLILPGAVALLMSAFEFDRGRPAFGGTYRFLGWVGVLLPLLFLAGDGNFSYIRLSPSVVAGAYLVVGFALGGVAVGTGIRQHSNTVVNTATLFLAVLLFVKLFDWWWDWMPRYLFFFLLGLIAIGILVALRRLRARAWKV